MSLNDKKKVVLYYAKDVLVFFQYTLFLVKKDIKNTGRSTKKFLRSLSKLGNSLTTTSGVILFLLIVSVIQAVTRNNFSLGIALCGVLIIFFIVRYPSGSHRGWRRKEYKKKLLRKL